MSMQMDDIRVLMFARTMAMGGTEKVVLQLCRALKGKVGYLAVLSCGGELVDELDAMGVPHFVIPDIIEKNPRTFSAVKGELSRIVCENGINLVHCHHRMAALYSRLALTGGVRVVATGHNVFSGGRTATRFLYKGVRVAACGGRVYENLVDYYGLPEKQVALIPNSVPRFDGEVEDIADVANCSDGFLKIGFVGRLSEQKGAAFLIDAIALLADRGVAARCFIVGDGELGDELRERARKSAAAGNIVFMGPRGDSQNFLSQVDVCAMPSLWEGLPLVLLESFSVGTPVVGSAVDGLLDVVHDGESGLLVKPGDAKALADALEHVAGDRALLRRLSENACACYEADYSYEKWTQKYFDFYEEALR